MKTLADTIGLMTSPNYEDRLRAEYQQTRIRAEGLRGMLNKWDAGTLPFTPGSPRTLYEKQLEAMSDYLVALEARAALEGVTLW